MSLYLQYPTMEYDGYEMINDDYSSKSAEFVSCQQCEMCQAVGLLDAVGPQSKRIFDITC